MSGWNSRSDYTYVHAYLTWALVDDEEVGGKYGHSGKCSPVETHMNERICIHLILSAGPL